MMRSLFLPVLVGALSVGPISQSAFNRQAQAESWTDLRGTNTVEAEMLGIWGDTVVLRLTNGRRVSIKMDALRSDSRIQAQNLRDERMKTRQSRITELQEQRVEAAAPAPTPLPQPPPAPAYTPPQKDMAPLDFINQVQQSVDDGHVRAIYDALPPSYRSDVDELVKLMAAKMDRESFNATVSSLQDVGDLIVTRQRWLFSSPRFEKMSPTAQDTLQRMLLNLGGFLREGLGSELVDLQKLQSMPFGQWITEWDETVAPHLAQLNEVQSSQQREFTLEKSEGDTATLKVSATGVEVKMDMIKVDGFWVGTNWDAEGWPKAVEEAKAKIAEMDPAAMSGASAMLGPMTAMLSPLKEAGNENDFHAAMETLIQPVGGMVTAAMAMAGQQMPGRRPSMDEYDMEMDMEMDMDMEMEMEMQMQMEDQSQGP